MVLLASTKTREGADMMEAGIILHFEATSENIQHNYNWTTSADYGGEGPIREDEEHLEQYVYLALKPLPQSFDEWTAASAHQPEEPIDMTRNRSDTGPSPFEAHEFAQRMLRGGFGPAAAASADRGVHQWFMAELMSQAVTRG